MHPVEQLSERHVVDLATLRSNGDTAPDGAADAANFRVARGMDLFTPAECANYLVAARYDAT